MTHMMLLHGKLMGGPTVCMRSRASVYNPRSRTSSSVWYACGNLVRIDTLMPYKGDGNAVSSALAVGLVRGTLLVCGN